MPPELPKTRNRMLGLAAAGALAIPVLTAVLQNNKKISGDVHTAIANVIDEDATADPSMLKPSIRGKSTKKIPIKHDSLKEEESPLALGDRARNGDVVAGEAIIDLLRAVDYDKFDDELKQTGLTIDEYKAIERGLRLKNLLNVLDDENFAEHAEKWARVARPNTKSADILGRFTNEIIHEIGMMLFEIDDKKAFDPLFLGMAGMIKENLQDVVLNYVRYRQKQLEDINMIPNTFSGFFEKYEIPYTDE